MTLSSYRRKSALLRLLTPRFVPRSTTLTLTLTNSVSTRITSSSETSSGVEEGRAGVPAPGFCSPAPISCGRSAGRRSGTDKVSRRSGAIVCYAPARPAACVCAPRTMLPACENKRTALLPCLNARATVAFGTGSRALARRRNVPRSRFCHQVAFAELGTSTDLAGNSLD